jgi:hypothetical protein
MVGCVAETYCEQICGRNVTLKTYHITMEH